MKITNISEKIISVNGTSLMPGDSRSFKNEEASVPGVRVLRDLRFITIEADEKKAKKIEAVVEEVPVGDEDSAGVPDEVEKPKRSRRKAEVTE